ncbi:MAG: DUF86 domain-containing protein [Nanoarchaeota archaeon]
MKRDVNLFIEDIINSIKNVEEFSEKLSKNEFLKNKLKQRAIERELEIIGEAVKNIPESLRNKYPEIRWKGIAGFRDILSHAYFGIISERIWNIIQEDILIFKKQMLKIKIDLESKK